MATGSKQGKTKAEKYGVALPLDALFRELARVLDPEEYDRLRGLHSQASVRYSRAIQLRQYERWLKGYAHYDTTRAAYYQYCLDHAQEFIDGKVPSFTKWKQLNWSVRGKT